MLTITEAAGEHLTTLLENAKAPEETAIRFALEGDKLMPKLDTAQPGDETFVHAGRMVLVLAPDALADRLVAIGYARADVVEHRGEFAIRGGIVDLFPSTARRPRPGASCACRARASPAAGGAASAPSP